MTINSIVIEKTFLNRRTQQNIHIYVDVDEQMFDTSFILYHQKNYEGVTYFQNESETK